MGMTMIPDEHLEISMLAGKRKELTDWITLPACRSMLALGATTKRTKLDFMFIPTTALGEEQKKGRDPNIWGYQAHFL